MGPNTHGKRHPPDQALAARFFLYKNVLGINLPWLSDVVRAKRPVRLPVVLSPIEVARIHPERPL